MVPKMGTVFLYVTTFIQPHPFYIITRTSSYWQEKIFVDGKVL